MKKLIAFALITLFATSTALLASPDKETLITAEKNAWQNIKDKKWDDFKKIFSADFRGVYASGINKLDKEMTGVKTLDLKSYTLGDMDVVFIGKDAALLAYGVTSRELKTAKMLPGE